MNTKVKYTNLGVMPHACNSSTQEMEAEGSEVQGKQQ